MSSDRSIERLTRRVSHPRITSYILPIQISRDHIQFRIGPWSGPVYDVEDEDGDGKLSAIIERLDGNRSVAEILEQFDHTDKSAIAALLVELYESGIVCDSSDSGPLRDYSLVKPYLSDESIAAFQSAQVLIISTGLIGGYVAEDLLHMGIGSVSYLPIDDQVRENIPDSHTDFEFTEELDIERQVSNVDLVIYAANRADAYLPRRINEAAYQAEIPWTAGQIQGLDGIIGPTTIPGQSSCYECYIQQSYANISKIEGFMTFEETIHRPANIRMPPFSRIVAGCLVVDIVNILSFGFGFTVGNVIHYDFIDMSVESNSVLKLPRCPICRADQSPINHLISLDQVKRVWGME